MASRGSIDPVRQRRVERQASLTDPATMSQYVQSLPFTAFLIVLIAHAGSECLALAVPVQ